METSGKAGGSEVRTNQASRLDETGLRQETHRFRQQ
jgi:hypothetical protein